MCGLLHTRRVRHDVNGATPLDAVRVSRSIGYAFEHDAAATVRQVRVHNLTGQKRGRWK